MSYSNGFGFGAGEIFDGYFAAFGLCDFRGLVQIDMRDSEFLFHASLGIKSIDGCLDSLSVTGSLNLDSLMVRSHVDTPSASDMNLRFAGLACKFPLQSLVSLAFRHLALLFADQKQYSPLYTISE